METGYMFERDRLKFNPEDLTWGYCRISEALMNKKRAKEILESYLSNEIGTPTSLRLVHYKIEDGEKTPKESIRLDLKPLMARKLSFEEILNSVPNW